MTETATSSTSDDAAIAELDATRAVYEQLKPLSPEAQTRVLQHVSGLLAGVGFPRLSNGAQEEAELQREQKVAPKFQTFAELYNEAQPKTQHEKALVAGYWFQVCQGAATFEGFALNKELTQLGERVGNITAAIDILKNEKPARALQVAKSGKSKQARKTYKLSLAGIKSVEEMIGG